jgi:enoyl-CoA hydratase
MEAILTGEPIPAQRAFDLGLLSRLVGPGEALDEALRLAGQVTACAPLAVWESRAIVRAAATENDETLIARTNEAFGRIMGSDDTREGLEAFIDKRAPNWKGR